VPCGCPAAFLVSFKSSSQSAVAILGQIWVSKSLRVVKQETHRVEMRRAELASRCAECPFPWFLAARPPSFRQAQDLAYVTTPQSQRFDAAVGGDSAASQASPLRWYQIKFYGTVDWAISDTDTTGRGPRPASKQNIQDQRCWRVVVHRRYEAGRTGLSGEPLTLSGFP
jgi:hypothetical protein